MIIERFGGTVLCVYTIKIRVYICTKVGLYSQYMRTSACVLTLAAMPKPA